MSGSGKDVSGMVGISRDEVRAGTFPDRTISAKGVEWSESGLFMPYRSLSLVSLCGEVPPPLE